MNIGKSCKVLASALLCATLLTLPAESAPSGTQQVDLKLVIATDVSRSINDEEATIQREGMAEAFNSPEVVKAIQSGALGRIAVAMLDWSSPEFNRVVLDWTIIDGKNSAAEFAEQVRNAPRTPGRRTSISGAIEMGALMLEASEKNIVATRRVIDVSGDGPNNDGRPLSETHKEVIAPEDHHQRPADHGRERQRLLPEPGQIFRRLRRRRHRRVRRRRAQLQGFRRGDAAQADPGNLVGRKPDQTGRERDAAFLTAGEGAGRTGRRARADRRSSGRVRTSTPSSAIATASASAVSKHSRSQ